MALGGADPGPPSTSLNELRLRLLPRPLRYDAEGFILPHNSVALLGGGEIIKPSLAEQEDAHRYILLSRRRVFLVLALDMDARQSTAVARPGREDRLLAKGTDRIGLVHGCSGKRNRRQMPRDVTPECVRQKPDGRQPQDSNVALVEQGSARCDSCTGWLARRPAFAHGRGTRPLAVAHSGSLLPLPNRSPHLGGPLVYLRPAGRPAPSLLDEAAKCGLGSGPTCVHRDACWRPPCRAARRRGTTGG